VERKRRKFTGERHVGDEPAVPRLPLYGETLKSCKLTSYRYNETLKRCELTSYRYSETLKRRKLTSYRYGETLKRRKLTPYLYSETLKRCKLTSYRYNETLKRRKLTPYLYSETLKRCKLTSYRYNETLKRRKLTPYLYNETLKRCKLTSNRYSETLKRRKLTSNRYSETLKRCNGSGRSPGPVRPVGARRLARGVSPWAHQPFESKAPKGRRQTESCRRPYRAVHPYYLLDQGLTPLAKRCRPCGAGNGPSLVSFTASEPNCGTRRYRIPAGPRVDDVVHWIGVLFLQLENASQPGRGFSADTNARPAGHRPGLRSCNLSG
jgi:hypothetical protein